MNLIDTIKAKKGTIGNARYNATFNGNVWVDSYGTPIEDIEKYFNMPPMVFLTQIIGSSLQPRVTFRTDKEYWAIHTYQKWRCYQHFDSVNLRNRFVGEKTEAEFKEWINEI